MAKLALVSPFDDESDGRAKTRANRGYRDRAACARERSSVRDSTNAAQAAANFDRKSALNAYNAGSMAPAAIMSPMFAGKQKRTVKKLVTNNNSDADSGPMPRMWVVSNDTSEDVECGAAAVAVETTAAVVVEEMIGRRKDNAKRPAPAASANILMVRLACHGL